MAARRPQPRCSLQRFADKPLAIWISLIWLGTLGILSLLPKHWKTRLGDRPGFHQVEHILVFALTTFLLLSLSRRITRRIGAMLIVSSMAIASEVLQYLFTPPPYAIFEWWDVRDDFVGIVGSALLFRLLFTTRRN